MYLLKQSEVDHTVTHGESENTVTAASNTKVDHYLKKIKRKKDEVPSG